MALNISIVSVPWTVFIIVLFLVLAAIVALTVIEVRMSRRAKSKKQAQETYYQRKLSATMALRGDSNSFLISLDKVAREFFSEAIGLNRMGRYSELVGGLKKKQMVNEARFCERMQEVLYSGEKIDQSVLHSLFSQMQWFVMKKDGSAQPLKQEPTAASVPAREVQGVNSSIINYITEGKKRGFEVSLLVQKLLESGFDKLEIDKAVKQIESEMNRPRIPHQTEKRVLTRFSDKKGHTDLIRKGVNEKDEIANAEIIEIVPYERPKIPVKKVDYPEKEPEIYKRIGNMDNLDRVKAKIDSRKKGVVAS